MRDHDSPTEQPRQLGKLSAPGGRAPKPPGGKPIFTSTAEPIVPILSEEPLAYPIVKDLGDMGDAEIERIMTDQRNAPDVDG